MDRRGRSAEYQLHEPITPAGEEDARLHPDEHQQRSKMNHPPAIRNTGTRGGTPAAMAPAANSGGPFDGRRSGQPKRLLKKSAGALRMSDCRSKSRLVRRFRGIQRTYSGLSIRFRLAWAALSSYSTALIIAPQPFHSAEFLVSRSKPPARLAPCRHPW
jgi:hypothetical protein